MGTLTVVYYAVCKLLMNNSIKKRLKIKGSDENKLEKKNASYSNAMVKLINLKFLKLMPEKSKNSLSSKIKLSRTKYTLEEIILLKLMIVIIFIIVSLFLTYAFQSKLLRLFIVFYFCVIAYMLPDIILKNIHKRRQEAIRKSLPYFIEYLTLCTEAGLGLDMAIARIVERMKGPLSEELSEVVSEIKYGKSKREAYGNMIARVNLPEVKRLFSSILSTEQIGGSLKSVIKLQGDKIIQIRKQRIQEQAYKMPVKLLFPLIFFIFPSFFIVLLGPAVLQLMNIF